MLFARRISDRLVVGEVGGVMSDFRDSIVVSISACHADDPGSIPGRGAFLWSFEVEVRLWSKIATVFAWLFGLVV